MKKQKYTNKGITLIALIITIIVLLILAGVALSSLFGDNGILNNAESAKNQTNLANSKEQVALAVTGAMSYQNALGTVTKANLVTELNQLIGEEKYEISGEDAGPWTVMVKETGYSTTISSIGKITESAGGNGGGTADRDTTTLLSGTGTTPWLPNGFSQVAGTSLETGLTIANTNNGTPGTQNYVWIEVPTTISASITRDGIVTTVTLADAQNNDEILEILEVYAGKGTGTSYIVSTYVDKWYDANGNRADSENANVEDDTGCGMTYSQYQKAYEDMLKSIQEYGGFWLAQYEAGIQPEATHDVNPTNRKNGADRITTFASANYAKNQYPYNYVYCSEAQKIANADSTSTYTSSLPFGIQWNLVCKFIEVKTELEYDDIAIKSTWGNYENTIYKLNRTAKYSTDHGESFDLVYVNEETAQYEKTTAGEVLVTTGAIEETTTLASGIIKDASPMNIYDFAGNLLSWTLETYNKHYPCVNRGGLYRNGISDNPAHNAFPTTSAKDSENFGFRSVLY